jgi:vacuolar-type H+-ATPase subunit I/STV1
MNWNDEKDSQRIRELERRIRELEDLVKRQEERLEEEMKARGWK